MRVRQGFMSHQHKKSAMEGSKRPVKMVKLTGTVAFIFCFREEIIFV